MDLEHEILQCEVAALRCITAMEFDLTAKHLSMTYICYRDDVLSKKAVFLYKKAALQEKVEAVPGSSLPEFLLKLYAYAQAMEAYYKFPLPIIRGILKDRMIAARAIYHDASKQRYN